MTEKAKIIASSFERPKDPNCLLVRIAEVAHTGDDMTITLENGHCVLIGIEWSKSPWPGDVLVIGADEVFLWERGAVPQSLHDKFDKQHAGG